MAVTSGSETNVYESLILHVTPDKFIIEPSEAPNELLVIDRVSKELSLQANQGQIPPSATRKPIYGIVGIIHLLAGPYLIVITKKSKVGEINGKCVWRVEDTEVLPYSRTLLHLTEEQVQYNKIYLAMVQTVLQVPYFYFCTNYDLSHTLQRLYNTAPDFLNMAMFERADSRFLWNSHMMTDLQAQQELHRYWLPLIHGFISIRSCTINQQSFTWSLVSRRSCLRAGTRLFMRGIDSDGHPANFVETEQILEYNGARGSFVQTRGSIPLFWNQLPNLKYKPSPTVLASQNHLGGFQKHFNSQIVHYGKQVLINLIDHKGPEDRLEKAYDELVKAINNNNVRYVPFDFHHECRRMRWDRLSILMDRVNQEIEDLGYFLMLADGSISYLQDGVFRTNCIDCLDRTNVVQSLLARRVLQSQMEKLEILRKGQKVEDQIVFEAVYKNVWADNADICSVEYAGTGALKTDYTRTGKRTPIGALKDGWNSMIRYYKNNFADGFRQDAIDLFLGNHAVEENEGVGTPCPLKEKRDWKYITLPMILLAALSMCILCLLLPPVYTTETVIYAMFWVSMVAVTLSIILFYGTEFVDYPRLRDLRPKLKYE